MAYEFSEDQSLVNWNGVVYDIHDPGGDGHCLFNSLAHVLVHHQVDAEATGAGLRTLASRTLESWAEALPAWYDTVHYEQPTAPHAAEVAITDPEPTWGDLRCILAILGARYLHVRVLILNTSSDDTVMQQEEYTLDMTAFDIAPTVTVHLMHVGDNHYVALTRRPPQVQGSHPGTQTSHAPRPSSPKLFAKVGTSDTLSQNLTTHTVSSAQAELEIHHIDVGQADATLILLKGRQGGYVKSILIDCGKTVDRIRGYLDRLARQSRFRRIDLFIASHYDADHIGAADTLLVDPTYVQDSLVLYDMGVPEQAESDYFNYVSAFGEPNEGRRRIIDMDAPLVSEEGLTLTCVGFGGMSPALPGDVPFDDEEEEEEGTSWYSMQVNGTGGLIPSKFPKGLAGQAEWLGAGLTPSDILPFDKNDNSIALLLEFGAFRYFTAGDLNGGYEDRVVDVIFHRLGGGHVCAFKLNHHGAHEATSPRLLERLRPRFGVIPCGVPNSYGHPSALTLARLDVLAAKHPFHYWVTANLYQKQAKGLPWAAPTRYGRHSQGSIVLKLRRSDADAHTFHVCSDTDAVGEQLQCGERPFDESFHISEGKKSRPRTEEYKKQRQDSRQKRQRLAQEALALLQTEIRGRLEALLGVAPTAGPLHDELNAAAARLASITDERRREQKLSTLRNQHARDPLGSDPERIDFLRRLAK